MPHTLLYFLALLSLSTSPNWAKLNHMPSEVLGFYRLGIAAGLLGLWLLVRRQLTLPRDRKNMGWILLSGFFLFLHLWTYKYASKTTSVSNTMIIFTSNPVWASAGAILFFGEKLKKRLLASYILALTSVFLLVAHNLGSVGSRGDWSAAASAVLYAAYMLAGKKARLHYDNTFYSFLQYALCALFFLLAAGITGAPLGGYDQISWVAVAGLVLLPTFFGHFSFTYLVEHMSLSVMTCGKLVEPVIASLIASYVFGEQLGPYSWISFLLTAAAVLILFGPALVSSVRSRFAA